LESDDLYLLKKQELELYQKRLALQEMLPHRYGLPWYKWAYEFYIDRNKEGMYLIAGNQVSKSSTQIRKCIEWGTNQELWPELWPDTLTPPNCFWYFYPTQDVADAEFKLKWSQFLPKDKTHPVYGWRAIYEKGKIKELMFNSGVTVYFKSYKQHVQDLQTGTVYAMFCDEEMPLHLRGELMARLTATSGYFHMVFTATLGQEFWRLTIEPTEEEQLRGLENYPKASKWQVDLEAGDCTWYMDGTPSPWSREKVTEAINRCRTETEKARRVNGRFVVEGGLRYESFSRDHNTCSKHPLPRSWLIFTGLDYGSGGEGGHPSAYIFVGVSGDYRSGRVFLGKRFDDQVTTAGDVIEEYAIAARRLNVVTASYDYSATDLYTIASRAGLIAIESEQKAG
jgi:phage terminase large subunit-like protein